MTDARKKGAAAAAQAADEMPQVEKAVLACALLDAKCAALLVNRGVRMDWFHDTRSRELCVRILDAIAAGRPVEPVALAVELQQAGKNWGVRFVEERFDQRHPPHFAAEACDRIHPGQETSFAPEPCRLLCTAFFARGPAHCTARGHELWAQSAGKRYPGQSRGGPFACQLFCLW